jgi:hypothetical protein
MEMSQQGIDSAKRKWGRAMREEARELFEMVRKRVPDKEIMDKLGIQTKASLRRMYYDALVETGKIKDIVKEQFILARNC